MVKYILIYFKAQGTVEVARLLFAHAKVEFENFMFTKEEWPSHKPDRSKYPMGQLPVLEVDGEVICQSQAINIFVAEQLNLYGANNKERAAINQVTETLVDYFKELVPILFANKENMEQMKIKMKEHHDSDKVKGYFEFLESMLKKNNEGNSFFVGDTITLADMTFFHTMSFAFDFELPSLLKSLKERIAESANIKAYLEARTIPLFGV